MSAAFTELPTSTVIRRRVPIRWLAPETIRTQIYNFKTDVYSFGEATVILARLP